MAKVHNVLLRSRKKVFDKLRGLFFPNGAEVKFLRQSPTADEFEQLAALVAYHFFQPIQLISSWIDRYEQLLSSLGLLLLIASFLFISEGLTFPGWWALMPTLGAALIILAGRQTLVNKLLSFRALVGFGLISFPLYLWHWPLLSFARVIHAATPSVTTRLFLLVLSIVWLS